MKNDNELNLVFKLWIAVFLSIIFLAVWYIARVFSYDICSAKSLHTVSAEDQYKLFTPTSEELNNFPDMVNEKSQITGFYRGVLKCYTEAQSRFYLWY